MIDLTGLKLPDNAPEPGACVRIERPEPGLAVLILDPPHRKLAVLDAPLLSDLDRALGELESDPDLRGVVLTGRDPSQFAAGADIDGIRAITDPAVVERVVLAVHGLFRRLEALRARTVAAVGGPVPGGAYEISLACDRIVATDDKKTRIGLPEALLGILPAWGGSHRLPLRTGVPLALDAILAGKLLPAKAALRRGMIDRVAKPEYLVRVASDIAMGRMKCVRRSRGWKRFLVDKNPLAIALIRRQAEKQVLARTKGHYPAPLAALRIVLDAPRTRPANAAGVEARAVAELATGPICKNLVSIFFASEEAKKLGRGPDGERTADLERGAVVGAGVMGGAIASLLAEKGLATRLVDLSREAVDVALLDHRAEMERRKKRRRFERHEAEAAVDRLDGATEMVGLGTSQVIVEAVAEVLDVKRKVLGALAAAVPDDCILATNTSSLSVGAIAAEVPHPERVIGLHFFNPVRRMPLVEIVRGRHTSDAVVARTAALALRLGKTPVIVQDVAGFLVNRLLGPYLDEAVRLFVGGADPVFVDRALTEFGMPMGPFELLDEVGLDIAAHAAESLFEAYGERMQPSDGIGAMMGAERLGKKTGLGFYRHPQGKKKASLEIAADLTRFQTGSFARSLSAEDVVDRCVLAMVNEAARCLSEDVVTGPVELDLATVFGTGFAPFRGGLLRYADTVGLPAVVDRLRAIAASSGVAERPGGTAKFTPAPLLEDLASKQRGFHDPPESPADAPATTARAG